MSDDKVVSLRGVSPARIEVEAIPAVVEELEEWLERAKAGKIIGVAIVAEWDDGKTGARRAGVMSRALVGQAFGLATRMSASLDADIRK